MYKLFTETRKRVMCRGIYENYIGAGTPPSTSLIQRKSTSINIRVEPTSLRSPITLETPIMRGEGAYINDLFALEVPQLPTIKGTTKVSQSGICLQPGQLNGEP